MGDYDLVVGSDSVASPGLSYKVDGLRRASGEDHICGRRRSEKVRHRGTCPFVGVRGPRRQGVGGAVDIRVLVRVEVRQAVDDNLWLLRRRAIVEPYELTSVDPLLQDREVASHGLDVEGRVGLDGHYTPVTNWPVGSRDPLVDEVERRLT